MIISSKQKEFIKNDGHRYAIKVGARRCGKTYLDILYTIPNRILALKDKDGLNVIFGVSKGTIERNVLQPMRELYGKECIGNINSQNIVILFGQEVYCLGTEKINQVSKIQGTSIKYAYIDEAGKMNEDVFNMIKGSLDKEYSCCDMALNPEHKQHWLKKNFLDKIEDDEIDAFVQHYTIFDNPFLPNKVKENIVKDMRSAGEHYYNRYILGQWCNSEGLCFPEFAKDNKKYIWQGELPKGYTIVGIDYGGTKSAHAFVCTRISYDYSKVIILASRKLHTKVTSKELEDAQISFIQYCMSKYDCYIDDAYPDSAESVHINSLELAVEKQGWGTSVRGSRKIRVNDRIELVNKLISNNVLYYIKDECSTIVEALESAMWNNKKFEDERLDDGSTDIDTCDAFEYTIEREKASLLDAIRFKEE